ncbi:hypothetical protein AYI98_07630 [Shewanella algae]|uniref:protein DpdJ n=1 Tax=Shewanella algae TaxID=38313 RepID=UPI001182B60B|nr:protein DpdJ [Shewanella algae]TVL50792.1 hypothetical protein AYI98_07630 [Shewanella algae]
MTLPLCVMHRVLDRLEEQELPLLSWGDTGGFFTQTEVLDAISSACPEYDPEQVFLGLLQRAMLHEVPDILGQQVYRTRMAESVHLYRNLRQWFHGKPVEQARTLVSDFRFVRRPRSYPIREIEPRELLAEWKSELPLTSRELHLIELLLSPLDKFRLSGFQARATARILRAWHYHNRQPKLATGTIVCAGTGSGKTLSFYLPAITSLANDICSDPTPRVRILAIYPRKELLKDQFMETWGQCRKLDEYMQQNVGRKIRIGSFFGDTPKDNADAQNKLRKHSGSGLNFDLLRCGNSICKGRMQWLRSSMQQQREELVCSLCGHTVSSDEVGLTRQSLSSLAPDILFTTTEMLNQQLGNNYQNQLFGVGYGQKGPVLVLLDEVHTYGGNTGAQTAYLLRRWMHRAYCRPHFVGLSATLADAESFFTDLTGACPNKVELVGPRDDEIMEEGAEYLLALRGDPVSQTALLSTSIQAGMLTRRILDTPSHRSDGTWGSKTFIFTDDLDVTNRLYHQLSDAEGWRTSYQGSTFNNPPLASLRKPDDDPKKIELGQNWRLAQDVGHPLTEDDRAKVARTSSQDSGVDNEADIVVATASLEVGFNDPTVGAVIQHKAPRDVASYLQRKGRAGRSRTMRPWMLVVLSEFGRDRVAFQRYEELISPEIKRHGLPIHNNHIQKMQAAMATLDWCSLQLGKVSIWNLLNYPNKGSKQKQLMDFRILVESVLEEGRRQDDLFRYLRFALKVEDDVLQRILWTPPRSIMLEFLPTLHRQLTTYWASYGNQWGELTQTRSPMPEFIPDALFSELNLPSLGIQLWRGPQSKRFEKWESLPFLQAMREFAPGRVSKRYATSNNLEADWLVPEHFRPVANEITEVDFEITEAFGYQLAQEALITDAQGHQLLIVKPNQILSRPLEFGLGLTEKSNAQLHWKVTFNDLESAAALNPPAGSWKESLQDVTFFTHQHMTPLEVIRYCTGSTASLRFKNGQPANAQFHWKYNGQPVGVGNRQWVDGMRLRFRLSRQRLRQIFENDKLLQGLRPVYFQHLVTSLIRFEHDPFRANWVVECYLAALAAELLTDRHANIQEAISYLATAEGCQKLQKIPTSLFQPEQDGDLGNQQKLQMDLQSLLSDPQLQQDLFGCSDALWQNPCQISGLEVWGKQLLANTLAAATQQTLCTLLTDVDERSVVADTLWINSREDEDCEVLEIWLTESEPGGCGIISRLSDAYYSDPMRILNILVCSLQPGDYEQIDYDLFNLLGLLNEDVALQEAVANVRFALSHTERKSANKELRHLMRDVGFSLTHSFMTVLYSRLLRPGSDEHSDVKTLKLLTDWQQLEQQSGIEWGLNIAAHALVSAEHQVNACEHFRALCINQGMLWPRGYTIRQTELNYYNPFLSNHAFTERLLGELLFSEKTRSLTLEEDWLSNIHEILRKSGRVDLILERNQVHRVLEVITELQVVPLDHLGLLLYPRIGSVRRSLGRLILRIELAEALQ